GAREADPVQQRLEQLSRLADEGDAVLVLVEPGRLADEHQLRMRIAEAEDHLRSRLGERAAGAGARRLLVLEQQIAHGSESTSGAGRSAAAAAAAAATAAAELRLRGGADDREARELLEHLAGAALGTCDRLLRVPDELLEVRLALHA